MSEDLRAHGVNLDYDPDKDPTATAGEAQAWKHGRDVGRAERDAEVRALVGWILEQGAHPSDCAFYGAKECDCGYERVLKPFEEAQP